MKPIFTTLSLLLVAGMTHAQTTATNFTATDCKGDSHTLFTELDAGKTVILDWVMPCGACDAATKASYNAAKAYNDAHPGDKVVFYLISDYGDDNCSTLENYATTMGLDLNKIAVFDNAGKVINQDDFGGDGMPHVVIASGNDHKIYFNEKNGTGSGAAHALNQATNVNEVRQSLNFSMGPNPVSDILEIRYGKAIMKVTVLNLAGQVVKEFSFEKGQQDPKINFSRIPAGTYMVQVQDAEGRTGLQQIVKL